MPRVIPSNVVRGRKNPLHFGFAERLKRARRVADVSYAALGRQAGFGSRTTAALLENGERVPRVDTVEKLASALDISPAWLAFGLDFPVKNGPVSTRTSLAARLREARTAHRLSLREVGRRAGSSGSQVQQTEQGRTIPTLSTVEQLARALGISPAWLAFGLGPMTLPNPHRTKSGHREESSVQPSSSSLE